MASEDRHEQRQALKRPLEATLDGLAAATVCGAILLMLVAQPDVATRSPLLLFTPVVVAAAWYGGLWPGLLSTGIGSLVGAHFIARHAVATPEALERLVLFLLVGSLITVLGVRLKSERNRIAASLARERQFRAEAETANREKEELLAVVAHELRNPANVILGWSTTLRAFNAQDGTLTKGLQAIARNARLEARLIEDILDTYRSRRQSLRVEPVRLDLADVLHQAVEAAADAASDAGVSLHVAPPEGMPRPVVVADPLRLEQVFGNVISNAIKFTPPDGRVVLAMKVDGASVAISVTDTGRGIDGAFLPHVFEPFKRAERHGRTPGLGLGLAISRTLVELHGGRIEASSAGLGRGATFTVTLPLATAAVGSGVRFVAADRTVA